MDVDPTTKEPRPPPQLFPIYKKLFYELKNNFIDQDIYPDAFKSEQRIEIIIIVDKEIITRKLQNKCSI
jgi:hypothetical protein